MIFVKFMKYIYIAILTLVMLSLPMPSFGQTQTISLSQERIVDMHFDSTHINLGAIKKGEIKKTAFHFTNLGNEAIEIELVSACECTTLDWPRKAIQVGEKGKIDVVFDSSKKEEVETIDVDIILKNTDPKTGYGILEIVSYSYTFK